MDSNVAFACEEELFSHLAAKYDAWVSLNCQRR